VGDKGGRNLGVLIEQPEASTRYRKSFAGISIANATRARVMENGTNLRIGLLSPQCPWTRLFE
jgi:hypothetical protein